METLTFAQKFDIEQITKRLSTTPTVEEIFKTIMGYYNEEKGLPVDNECIVTDYLCDKYGIED
jgi:hypothetical protein